MNTAHEADDPGTPVYNVARLTAACDFSGALQHWFPGDRTLPIAPSAKRITALGAARGRDRQHGILIALQLG